MRGGDGVGDPDNRGGFDSRSPHLNGITTMARKTTADTGNNAGPIEPTSSPTSEPAKRNRSKSDYVIQKWIEAKPEHLGFWDDVPDDSGEIAETFVDTAAAIRHIREKKILGRLRVIAVKKELTVEEVQTTTLKVS